MALSHPVSVVSAAAVLLVQDEALGGGEQQVSPALHLRPGGQAQVPVGPSVHLLLQVAQHSGQQPHLLALLGVGDEEIHIMALQLPPEGASVTLPSSARPPCSQRPAVGKAHLRPLPPEAPSQRDAGPREGLAHGCLHHQLQGLRVRPLDRTAQVPIVLESCGWQALLSSQPSSLQSPPPF